MFGFWTGGAKAYRNAIAAEYRERLSELRASLNTAATYPEREICREQIQTLKKEYRAKKLAIRWSRFSISR